VVPSLQVTGPEPDPAGAAGVAGVAGADAADDDAGTALPEELLAEALAADFDLSMPP
jgi:organic hydroperoxide reductase OsmC/OhrA